VLLYFVSARERSQTRMKIPAALIAAFFGAWVGSSALAVGAPDEPQQGQASPVVAKPGPASRPEKEGYTLFNPTPESLLRGLNTDRPDVTESPFTVDAGHFQTELSFVEYTYDYDHGSRTDGY